MLQSQNLTPLKTSELSFHLFMNNALNKHGLYSPNSLPDITVHSWILLNWHNILLLWLSEKKLLGRGPQGFWIILEMMHYNNPGENVILYVWCICLWPFSIGISHSQLILGSFVSTQTQDVCSWTNDSVLSLMELLYPSYTVLVAPRVLDILPFDPVQGIGTHCEEIN